MNEYVNLKTGEIIKRPNKQAAMEYFINDAHGDPKWMPTEKDVITYSSYRQSVRRGQRK